MQRGLREEAAGLRADVLAAPPGERGLPSDRATPSCAELFCARAAAFQTTEPPKRDCVWVLSSTHHDCRWGNGAATKPREIAPLFADVSAHRKRLPIQRCKKCFHRTRRLSGSTCAAAVGSSDSDHVHVRNMTSGRHAAEAVSIKRSGVRPEGAPSLRHGRLRVSAATHA